MKKNFLSCVGIFAALAIQAQSEFPLQFADKDGNIIPDGTIIKITDVQDDGFGGLQMPTNLYVKNIGSEKVQTAGVFVIESIDNGTFQTCFPANCIRQDAPGEYTTTQGEIAAGELKSMQTEWLPAAEGSCKVTYRLQSYSLNTNTGKWILDGEGPQVTLNFVNSQMWWGYFSEAEVANLPFEEGHLGYSQACTIDAAIRVTANHAIVGGSTIKAIRLWLGNDISTINSDMTVWISKTRPSNINNATYKQTVALADLKGGENLVELTTPFEVKNQNLYIGYTFSINAKSYPVMGGGMDVTNGFFYRVNSGTWNDFNGQGYGNLALQLLLLGGNYPNNKVTPYDFGQLVVLTGSGVAPQVTFRNGGKDPVTSISYTLAATNCETTVEQTVDVNSVAYNGTFELPITLVTGNQSMKYENTLTVTKVNGVENMADKTTAKGSVIVIDQEPPVLPVVEEFTGTWCGYCPYGIVGMQKAHEAYGDQVVLIAAHSDDVMQISGYQSILSGVGSFPSAYMNREYGFYPSTYYIFEEISYALNRTTQGTIELKASWSDETMTKILFDTKTKFVYDDNDGKYGIAFVLVEDGMRGKSDDWKQRNYLSGYTGDDEMSFWYDSDEYVSVEFNHVAVLAWGIKNGVTNSVGTEIKSGVVQDFSYTGNISSNTLIQDKSRLKAIALLIDKVSGAIVNAAQTEIADYTVGIKNMNVDGQQVVGSYSIGGQVLSAPQKGLNIVRMADGRTVKVVKR